MGVGSELPRVTRLGCSFHWTQAVWRKAQEIGLKPAYVNDEGTHVFIKKILALPILPARQIEPIFCSLTKDREWKETTPQLLELIKYVNGTWIVHNTWNPDAWSVYGHSIRTNNDVEGYHNRLNSRGRREMPLYQLFTFLHQESTMVPLTCRLVSEDRVRRYQRVAYIRLQGAYFALWLQYNDQEIH